MLATALASCMGAFAAASTSNAGAASSTGGAVSPTSSSSEPACPGAGLHPTATNTGAVKAATLCLVDQARAARRLPPLRTNRELGQVANSQVSAMVLRNYFSDVSPSGQTPLSMVFVTHYPAHAAGISIAQNIAWGDGRDTTPARIVSAWMASRSHRAIILTGEYRDAGVAVEAALPRVLGAGRRGATYVMEFGARFR